MGRPSKDPQVDWAAAGSPEGPDALSGMLLQLQSLHKKGQVPQSGKLRVFSSIDSVEVYF